MPANTIHKAVAQVGVLVLESYAKGYLNALLNNNVHINDEWTIYEYAGYCFDFNFYDGIEYGGVSVPVGATKHIKCAVYLYVDWSTDTSEYVLLDGVTFTELTQ